MFFLSFHTIHGVLKARIVKWFATPFSSGPHFFSSDGPITSWQIDGETVETVADFIWGAPKSLQMVTAAMKLKNAYSLEGKL